MGPRKSIDPPEEFISFLGKPPLHPNRKPLEVANENGVNSGSSGGYLRSDHLLGYSWRKIILLFILACFALIVLGMSHTENEIIETGIESGESEAVHHEHMDVVSVEEEKEISENRMLGFHNPSPQNFITASIHYKPKGVGYPIRPVGGLHPIYYQDLNEADRDKVDKSNGVVEGDYSTSSPYADPRLEMAEDERQKEQAEYIEKLQKIRDEWGMWNFVDHNSSRPVVDWETVGKEKKGYDVLSGEIEREEFGEGVWQADDEYVKNFLLEARALITRVRKAIFAEYGLETPSRESDLELGVHIIKKSDRPSKLELASKGAAWIHESSLDAFVKKLLNAMITNDHFFVTLGGHSAAAGHGNNFHQSYMMQFQEIMEPVFDRLGMVLVSANRAQGGMGTIQAAFAGESIYGEKDVMLWDSSMTEKGLGHQELFHRQMLLTGHRVPILLDMGGGKPIMDKLRQESGAHVGGMTVGTPSVMATTKSVEQAETLPFALRHLFCDKGVTTCTEIKYKYSAACWTDRVDVEPITEQNKKYQSQVSWHPGNRSHQWVARKLSLLFLHALDEAINVWEKAASSEGNPLPGRYWHLSEEENAIREKLLNVNVSTTECGKLLTSIPRMCKIAMRGATEWAPRANPYNSSMRSLLKPAPNGYVPDFVDLGTPAQLYDGRHPHIPIQKIPKGEIDVAAIARSIPAPESSRMLLATSQQFTNGAVHSLIDHPWARGNRLFEAQTTRHLTSVIIPGEGWAVDGNYAPGYCDGTSNQLCRRQPANDCIMGGHSDSRGEMVGDALSGWLTFQLKGVSQGIFAARIQYWHKYNSNKHTEGWDAVNNGRDDTRRILKSSPPPLPDDFKFEVAVDGVTTLLLNADEFKAKIEPQIAYNVPFIVLIDDEEMAQKNKRVDIEVSIRIEGGGRESVLGITHVYYA